MNTVETQIIGSRWQRHWRAGREGREGEINIGNIEHRTSNAEHRMSAAGQIADFFLSHRGRCFEGWSPDKVLNYVLVNLVNKNVFAVRDRCGAIALAAIASLGDAADIRHKAELDLPQFTWEGFPMTGDSILIADVAGDRGLMPEILKQVNATWPESLNKRLFTYRRGKLVELSWKTVMRFTDGIKLASRSSLTLVGSNSFAATPNDVLPRGNQSGLTSTATQKMETPA